MREVHDMEMIDVLDENGNYTGRSEERKIIHDKGLWLSLIHI